MDLTDFVIFDFLWFYPFAIIGGYWWEFHTVGSDGETLNDFSFSEVRALL